MKLAIYDKGGGNFRDVAGAAALAVFGRDAVPPFNPTIATAVDELRQFTHVVCHLAPDERDPSWSKLLAGDLARVQVIIRVSSQGAGGMQSFAPPHRLNETGPWILHLRERSAELAENRWQRIFNALKSWDVTEPVPPKEVVAIFDPNLETFLALQILCEAWLLKNWSDDLNNASLIGLKAALHLDGDKPQLPDNVAFNAPRKWDEWLKPFTIEGGGDPLAAILNEMPTEETKRIVRDFFSKLNDGQVEFEDVANLFLEMDTVVKKST